MGLCPVHRVRRMTFTPKIPGGYFWFHTRSLISNFRLSDCVPLYWHISYTCWNAWSWKSDLWPFLSYLWTQDDYVPISFYGFHNKLWPLAHAKYTVWCLYYWLKLHSVPCVLCDSCLDTEWSLLHLNVVRQIKKAFLVSCQISWQIGKECVLGKYLALYLWVTLPISISMTRHCCQTFSFSNMADFCLSWNETYFLYPCNIHLHVAR